MSLIAVSHRTAARYGQLVGTIALVATTLQSHSQIDDSCSSIMLLWFFPFAHTEALTFVGCFMLVCYVYLFIIY